MATGDKLLLRDTYGPKGTIARIEALEARCDKLESRCEQLEKALRIVIKSAKPDGSSFKVKAVAVLDGDG